MKNLDVMTHANWTWGGTTGYARYEFSDSFVDENGVEYGAGPSSYLEVSTTISGNVVTIPAYPNFPETEAALLNNGVEVTCWLLDSNRVKRTTLFEDVRIYTSLPSTVSLAQLVLANGASRLLRDSDVWTKEQVMDYVNTLAPSTKMTSLVYGTGRLSVPAVNVADPIVVGDNDPRLTAHLLDVTQDPYNVLNDGTAQSTAGLQAAIDAARDSNGVFTGVYLPPGNYKFNSGSLLLPRNLSLIGSWNSAVGHTWTHDAGQPDATDGKGTTIQVDVGAGGSVGAFITAYANTLIRGISFYYPSQDRTLVTPTAYPWTIFLGESSAQTHFDQTVENCEFVNSYQAIRIRYGGRAVIRNVRGAPIFGIDIDKSYDIAWFENVEFNAFFYSSHVSTPPADNWYKYLNQNGVGIKAGRVDQLNISHPYILGYSKGIQTVETAAEGTLPGGTAWMTVDGGGCEGCLFGVHLANAQTFGVKFTNFTITDAIDSSGAGLGYGMYNASTFRGVLQLNGVIIGGSTAPDYGLLIDGGGTVNVSGCVFMSADQNNILVQPASAPAAVTVNITGNTFMASTLASIKVDDFVTGNVDGNNFVQKTSTQAFVDTTTALYTVVFGPGNRFLDNTTPFGKGSAITGKIFNDAQAVSIYGNLQVAASPTLTPAAAGVLRSIAVGSIGYASLTVNAAFDGANWQRLDPTNEAWLILQEAKTDSTGKLYFRHANAGANPITWTDLVTFAPSGLVTFDTGTASAVAGAATLSKASGTITSEALTTAAGSDYVLTLTNTLVSATSKVFVSVDNGTNTTEGIAVNRVTPGAGSVVIRVRNTHAASALNGTIKINFLVH